MTLVGWTDAHYLLDVKTNRPLADKVMDVQDLATGDPVTDLQPPLGYTGLPFPAGQARSDGDGYYGFTVPEGQGPVRVRVAADPARNLAAGEWFTPAGQALANGALLGRGEASNTYARPAGVWAADVAYPKHSVVGFNGGTYYAPADVPAAATFDPASWQEWSPQPGQFAQADEHIVTESREGLLTASFSVVMFVAPYPCRILGLDVITQGGTASIPTSDTNYWTVRIRKFLNQTEVGLIADKTTKASGGAAVGRLYPWNFELETFDETHRVLDKGHSVLLTFLTTGAPTGWDQPFFQMRYETI